MLTSSGGSISSSCGGSCGGSGSGRGRSGSGLGGGLVALRSLGLLASVVSLGISIGGGGGGGLCSLGTLVGLLSGVVSLSVDVAELIISNDRE